MKSLQVHYTSCRRGLSGRPGYQIRGLTPGIEPAEEMEIERRCSYRPPRSSPPEPDPETLPLLPRDFRFGDLSSGRPALTLTTYVGRDYSGRWGNFFSHTLVFTDEPTLWPIDYYEWEGWKSRLDDEDAEPESLPAIDLKTEQAAESFTLQELKEFLGEEPDRVRWLELMLRAVFAGREEKRPLVIRDTPVQGLYWLACIHKAFPLPQALSLSFSSYQFEARKCSDLNVTTAATAFRLDRDEREYRFYVFDLLSGEASEVPSGTDDFPALASRWMSEEPAYLERFHAFARSFDHRDVDHDLTHAARLFDFLEGRRTTLSETAMVDALAFAERSAAPDRLGGLLESCCRAPGADLETPAELALVIFMIKTAGRTAHPEHRRYAVAAWRDCFERRAWGGGDDFQAVRLAFRQLENRLVSNPRKLAGELLPISDSSDGHLGGGQVPEEVLLFLLDRTVAWLTELALPRVGRDVRVTRLIEALSVRADDPQLLGKILDAGARNPGVLADFCTFLDGASPLLGACLAERLRRQPDDFALDVRQRLESRSHRQLLMAEALAIVGESEDPIVTFEAYHRQMATRMPATWRRQVGELVEALHRSVPEQYFCHQALIWLHEELLAEVPRQVATWLAGLINRQISIDPEAAASERHAGRLRQLGERLGIELMPDRPALRAFLARVRASEPVLSSCDCELLSHARRLTPEEYESFVAEVLPAVLESISDHEEHGQVVTNLACSEGRDRFQGIYHEWLAKKRKEPWDESREAALGFWLRCDPDSSAVTHDPGAFRRQVLDTLAQQLCRLKRESWAGLVQRLNARVASLATWQQFRENLEHQRKRGLGRLFRRA